MKITKPQSYVASLRKSGRLTLLPVRQQTKTQDQVKNSAVLFKNVNVPNKWSYQKRIKSQSFP